MPGAAIYVAGRADTIAEGVEGGREALADGARPLRWSGFVQASRAYAPSELAQ